MSISVSTWPVAWDAVIRMSRTVLNPAASISSELIVLTGEAFSISELLSNEPVTDTSGSSALSSRSSLELSLTVAALSAQHSAFSEPAQTSVHIARDTNHVIPITLLIIVIFLHTWNHPSSDQKQCSQLLNCAHMSVLFTAAATRGLSGAYSPGIS